MNELDKKYLSMQFRLRVHEKNATEFQSFFEDIMEAAFKDFRKIRPYGNQGDRGNDGYRPAEGIYYQVYAPLKPNEKEAEAARKVKNDFEKLKKNWDDIAKIKTFLFVFNDKWRGLNIEVEKALAELKGSNPEIDFQLFLPKQLMDIFFTLKKEDFELLGFDVDSRHARRLVTEMLVKMEVYLDRGNAGFVLELLDIYKEIIASLNDENLLLNGEILECRALKRLERVGEARTKYENLTKRYPNDPRPFLYLAELYLNAEDFAKNEELLRKAEELDSQHWLLQLEKVFRDSWLKKKIDPADIDETAFPADPKTKANFYTFYAVIFIDQKAFTRAESFIERALHFNPDRIDSYLVKLTLLAARIAFSFDGSDKERSAAKEFLREVDTILSEVSGVGQLSPRNQIIVNREKIKALYVREDELELERIAPETFSLIYQCHFDAFIDQSLSHLLLCFQLPIDEFNKLLGYLGSAEKDISNELCKALVCQFLLKGTLFTEGKDFFEHAKRVDILAFINDFKAKDLDASWDFLKNDLQFAISVASASKEFPDLQRKIIEKLPDDASNQRQKLLLLLNSYEENLNEAFAIVKGIDFSQSGHFECKLILDIARKKEAWDIVALILEKLLQRETYVQERLKLKLELFEANLKLQRLRNSFEIGEAVLSNNEELGLLSAQNKESLLAQTILSRMGRGEYKEALALLDRYPEIPNSYEFKLGIAVDVYLKNWEPMKAVEEVISGISMIKPPTPELYAKLYLPLIEISNMMNFTLDSETTVKSNSFVKLKDNERWYFVGEGDPLDAVPISLTDNRYAAFLDKAVGEKVIFEFRYRASVEYVIECVLPIGKYVFSQARRYFSQLATEGGLEAVEMIEVPKKGESIDFANLIALLENERKDRQEFFDLYCREKLPLAFLAASEGGLTNAIGLIQNEARGFIHFSAGDPAELKTQKDVAKRIIDGECFYIDGSSAMILSETGLLLELYDHLPYFRVPQSVIAMLLKVKKKVGYCPGQSGHLQYVQGKLRYSPASPKQEEILHRKFEDTIKLLEAVPERITVISTASKMDCFSEQKIPAELCDACVLAQKNNASVLTEDFRYLQVNHIQTGKAAPEYCSALALLRVLYEQKKISFERYLGFFAYLCGYRFWFLMVTADDMEKAVLGDGLITRVQPERIQWFNFGLTLSEAYGVPFAMAFQVVKVFLIRILTDDTIIPTVAERIFGEILMAFPTDKEKRAVGKLLLGVCREEIDKTPRAIIVKTTALEKIDRLFEFAEIFSGGNTLWIPSVTTC